VQRLAIIACGALAGSVRDIASRRGWAVEVHALPAVLHNRPERIAPAVADLARELRGRGLRVAVGYADCGTYGALDEVCAAFRIDRLRGLHCYDVLGGADRVRAVLEREPGTYLLTDYLVRSFERTVIATLGLDRYPHLWADYFGHYRRLVWLAQARDAALDIRAEAIAARFGLPLRVIDVGTGGLERELANLLLSTPAYGQAVGGGGAEESLMTARPRREHDRAAASSGLLEVQVSEPGIRRSHGAERGDAVG
jgi:Protein of unknown function (DUF1638)